MRFLALLICLLGCSLPASGQTYSMGWYRIAGGGGTSAGAPFQVSGTIGQPEAGGALTAGGFALTGGYWSQSFVPQAPAPEIAVEQPAGTDLLAGGIKDFGSVAPASTADLTFTIRNLGNADLTGLGITIDGTDSALFTVTASPSAPLSGPSGSTTFTVRFAPVSSGAKTATLHIASNDADENPFNLTLTGTGTPPPPSIIVSISGGMITLLWPDTATGNQVESTSSLLVPIIWSNEAGSPQTAGGFISLTVTTADSRKFFRLRKP